MSGLPVVVLASFLLAFKAVLLEGSEVAILALATVSQLGKRNVLVGVLTGAAGSVVIFLVVREFFVLLPDIVVSLLTGVVLLYFSRKFLKGFVRYYFGKRSFREKMQGLEADVLRKGYERPEGTQWPIPFSLLNSIPVMSITLTEGFEASLVLAAAGALNLEWTAIGGTVSILLLVTVALVSYDYLIRFPRWLLDLIAGVVLFSFGTYFALSGILVALGILS